MLGGRAYTSAAPPWPSAEAAQPMPRSSSGPGHRPLKAEIIGSNPIRGTTANTSETEAPMLASTAPNLFFVIVLPVLLLGSVVTVSVGVYKALGTVFRG